MEYSPTRKPTTPTISRKTAASASTWNQSLSAVTTPFARIPCNTMIVRINTMVTVIT
jgi:hypothetical protein